MPRHLLALTLLAATAPALAYARERPVCAQPEVLRLVADRLSRAGNPVIVQPTPIGQRPGPRPGTVLCAAYVHPQAVDTPRLGAKPLPTTSVYSFTLRLGHNGVFLEAP